MKKYIINNTIMANSVSQPITSHCGGGSCDGKVIVVVIKMVDFLVGSIALLHLVNIVAAAPNLEWVVLLVMISLKGRGYNSSAGLSRLRELLQWVRYMFLSRFSTCR